MSQIAKGFPAHLKLQYFFALEPHDFELLTQALAFAVDSAEHDQLLAEDFASMAPGLASECTKGISIKANVSAQTSFRWLALLTDLRSQQAELIDRLTATAVQPSTKRQERSDFHSP